MHDVDPRAVGQAGVAQRLGLVDAAAERREDALDRVRAARASEANADVGGLEPAARARPTPARCPRPCTSSTSGSASSGSSGPRPNERSAMRATSAARAAVVEHAPPRGRRSERIRSWASSARAGLAPAARASARAGSAARPSRAARWSASVLTGQPPTPRARTVAALRRDDDAETGAPGLGRRRRSDRGRRCGGSLACASRRSRGTGAAAAAPARGIRPPRTRPDTCVSGPRRRTRTST